MDYKEIYVKYKKKCLELKKTQKGGAACDEPIANVYGHTTIPRNYKGKCVTVHVPKWDGNDETHNLIVGAELPDYGNCSDTAKQYNDPVAEWHFNGNGYCGLGAPNENPDYVTKLKPVTGLRLGCMAHDTCVWSNCNDDRVKPAYGNAVKYGYELENKSKIIPKLIGYEASAAGPIVGLSDTERYRILKRGEPVCGKSLSQAESAFGFGFGSTWCPPGLTSSNPIAGIFEGTCRTKDKQNKVRLTPYQPDEVVFNEEVGTYEQKQRELRFWALNPHLITWVPEDEKEEVMKEANEALAKWELKQQVLNASLPTE